jgi:hypothetical protein
MRQRLARSPRAARIGPQIGAQRLSKAEIRSQRRVPIDRGSAQEQGSRRSRAHLGNVGFNLCYYQPIRGAIGYGPRHLHCGRPLCELKARRGCRILRTQRFYKGATPLHHLAAAPWFGVLARVARRRFADAHALADAGTRI